MTVKARKIIAMFGIFIIFPAAIIRKLWSIFESTLNGPPCPNWTIIERKIDAVARVTTKGTILPFVTNNPMIAARKTEKTTQNRSIKTILPDLFRITIPNPAVIAMFEPTDRSIIPDIMTNVMPSASIPLIVDCMRRVERLVKLR
jgi:hypothetical protein